MKKILFISINILQCIFSYGQDQSDNNGKGGDNFVGTWHCINSDDVLTINKDGNNYDLLQAGKTIILNYKDNVLKNDDPTISKAIYNPMSGHVFWQKKEFEYSTVTPVSKPGYHIHLIMPGVRDTMVFLAHYYGKNRPKIFKSDSIYFINGEADFKNNDTGFVGGIYILFLSDYKTNFEILLNRGDDMTITAPLKDFPNSISFTNSPENTRFEEYVKYLKEYGAQEEIYKKELANARTPEDTAIVRKKAVASSKELNKYRTDYEQKYPGTLLSKIFKGIETPKIPEGDHFLEDGKTKDSTFAYHYYKNHYWDGFDFHDGRLIYTPLYDAKLEEYFKKLVLPSPDSVEKEADILLNKALGSKDVFHYTLWWVTQYVYNSKLEGMNEVYVYFVDNYYRKGYAFWLTDDELQKIYNAASRKSKE